MPTPRHTRPAPAGTNSRSGATQLLDAPRGTPASRRADERAPASATCGQVLDTLRAIARELRVGRHTVDQRLAIHPAQLHALRQLAARPARSLAELAERTHTDPSSVSVVVQRLVERGLVARNTASYDRRRTELAVTAAGRALLRRAPESAARRLERALEQIGERDAAALGRSLDVVAQTLRRNGASGNGSR